MAFSSTFVPVLPIVILMPLWASLELWEIPLKACVWKHAGSTIKTLFSSDDNNKAANGVSFLRGHVSILV